MCDAMGGAGVCVGEGGGDEIIPLMTPLRGIQHPAACFCFGGVRACKSHILKRHSSLMGGRGGWGLEWGGVGESGEGALTSGRRGSVFSTWQNFAPTATPTFHPPVALGCRRRPAHSRIGSLGSSLFHYAHNLQLRHVRLVSLSSFVVPPDTVLLLLCI